MDSADAASASLRRRAALLAPGPPAPLLTMYCVSSAGSVVCGTP
jgi:hypothetical protein